MCPQCAEKDVDGVMKPDIVFFGEGLPKSFHSQLERDKVKVCHSNCLQLIVALTHSPFPVG